MSRAKLLSMGSTRAKETKRFFKFAFVGALGSVTDFSLLFFLVEVVGLVPFIANGFSFSAAVLQNFLLNRWWTFPESRTHSKRRLMLKFALVSIVGLGINLAVFLIVDQSLRPFWNDLFSNTEVGFRASYLFAKLFSIGVVLFWNFAANRLWTFKGL